MSETTETLPAGASAKSRKSAGLSGMVLAELQTMCEQDKMDTRCVLASTTVAELDRCEIK